MVKYSKKDAMKKIITTLLLLTIGILSAQIAIGKETIDGDGILDFKAGTTNGIIIPLVSQLPLSPENGTLLLDKSDLKVKVFENNQWVSLSDEGALGNHIENTSDDIGKGVVIGAETSTTEGVIVLESLDKALILPKIANPHENVKSPYPGMVCYDTASNALAVFDGKVWSYWK